MAIEGGSAAEKARRLRELAADARRKAENLDSMAANWEAGEEGERRVAGALAPLEGQSCHVLHDRLLDPGRSKVNLDHIVVSVAGVYLIDAKNWSSAVTINGSDVRRGTRLANEQVDKVRSMAGRMQLAASTVIEPVICLAGENAAAFGEPVQVRGVWIVPVEALATWLVGRPRPTMTVDLRSQAVRLAATFPSATEPAFLSMPGTPQQVPAAREHAPAARGPVAQGPVAPSSGRPRVVGTSRRAPSTRATKQSTHATSLWRFVGLVVSLLVALAVLPKVITAISNRATASTPWTAPCRSVTDVQVAGIVGRSVHRRTDGVHDTCTWSWTPARTAAAVTVTTGWAAQHSPGFPHGRAAFRAGTNTVTLAVPQFVGVPASTVPARSISQPMLVTIVWRGSPLTATTARRAAALLADQVARRLPSGTGATAITQR